MLLRTTLLILKWAFIMLIITANGNPPEEPVRCSNNLTNCIITNSYGAFPDRSICRAAEVVYPSTEEDLVSIVANATQNNRKMRVATRYSHSLPKLVCPDGDDGIIISTKDLARVIEIDKDKMLVTLESGVTLGQLISEAAKSGLALPYTPYWWGLTIGGLLGTGAHGSTLWGKVSAIHNYVVRMRMVTPGPAEEGYAKVPPLEENGALDEEMNAAKVSLGVLGVISQVTLRLQPMLKRFVTFITKNDTDLPDQAATFGKQHEFADIQWYPSQKRVVYRIYDRVSSNISGNGLWNHPGFRAVPSLALLILRSKKISKISLLLCFPSSKTPPLTPNTHYRIFLRMKSSVVADF